MMVKFKQLTQCLRHPYESTQVQGSTAALAPDSNLLLMHNQGGSSEDSRVGDVDMSIAPMFHLAPAIAGIQGTSRSMEVFLFLFPNSCKFTNNSN